MRRIKDMICGCLLVLIAGASSVDAWAQSPDRSLIRSLLDSVSLVRLHDHVTALAEAGGWKSRANFTPGNDTARSYILRQMQSLPSASVSLDTFFVDALPPYNLSPLFNVVGILPGSASAPPDVIVLGSHYDSQAGRDSGWADGWMHMAAPGADDNASGTAAVLEVMRIMTNLLPANDRRAEIHCVAFGAEEGTTPGIASYRNGSRHYAQRLAAEGRRVRAVINLDMIGFNPIASFGAVFADSQSAWLGERAFGTDSSYDIGLMLAPPPFSSKMWSDHASFWDEGMAAITLIENIDVVKPYDPYYPGNPNYHRYSDTVGVLSFDLMKRFTRLALAMVSEIASEEGSMTGSPNPEPAMPLEVKLRAFPNPFNPTVILEYHLPSSSDVVIRIVDVLGRLVEQRSLDGQAAGRHRIEWNGTGRSSGAYFVSLQTAETIVRQKILLLR